jgi:hypothetical protein
MRFSRIIALSLCAVFVGFVSTPATADIYDRHGAQAGFYLAAEPTHGVASRGRGASASSQVIGGRPSGCPHRFCGCALSIKLFGKIIPRLNLAANWKGFPSAAPAPGMVAARYGHVFQLQSHVSGSTWVVWDPNSGGGRIRVHARSIAGYTIHDPLRGSRYASLR